MSSVALRALNPHICDSALSPTMTPEPQFPSMADIQQKPWKFLGYRSFSGFVASDNDFFVIRRFGTLNARVILALQDRLSQLEEHLKELDITYSKVEFPDLNNGSFREDSQIDRRKTMSDIKAALLEYNQFLLAHSALKERLPAEKQEIQNVDNWFWSHPGAISSPETQYIEHKNDLITLVPKAKTPLRRFLERFQGFRLSPLFRIQPSDYEPYDPNLIHYSSDARIEQCVTVIVTLCGFVMLIAPLWILEFVPDQTSWLGIITAFIALFLGLVSAVTVAKPFESLAATAAYTAVLMVFVQLSH